MCNQMLSWYGIFKWVWGKVRKKTKIVKIKGCGDAFWILEGCLGGFYGGGVPCLESQG